MSNSRVSVDLVDPQAPLAALVTLDALVDLVDLDYLEILVGILRCLVHYPRGYQISYIEPSV